MAKKKKKKKAAAPSAPSGPVSNPALREAMASLREGNSPEKQAALQTALKEAVLLAPCSIEGQSIPAGGGAVHVPTNSVRFFLLNNNEGKTFFPAFTDPEAAAAFHQQPEKPALIQRTIRDYDRMMQDPKAPEGIIINPGSESLVIPAPLAAILSGRLQPQTAASRPAESPANAPVNAVYSEPAVYPTKMVNVLYDWCCEKPAVSRVWLKQRRAGLEIAFALFVEADEKSDALLQEMNEACTPYAKDVPVICEYVSDHIMKNVIKEAVALYDRELEL